MLPVRLHYKQSCDEQPAHTITFPWDVPSVQASPSPQMWYCHPVQRSVTSTMSLASSRCISSTSWLKLKPGHSLKAINSKAKETTGSFKLVPKNKRKIQPKWLSAMIAPRKPSGAKEKGPRKPSETKDPLNPGMVRIPKKPGEVKKTLSKPGAFDEKAPKKFSPS